MRKLNYHKSDRVTELERFWAKVDKTTPDECWEWLAFKDKFGMRHRALIGGRYAVPRSPALPLQWLANGVEPR